MRILALGLFPAALVFLQPDLGTALVYGVLTLAVLYIAGVRGSTSPSSARRRPRLSRWCS